MKNASVPYTTVILINFSIPILHVFFAHRFAIRVEFLEVLHEDQMEPFLNCFNLRTLSYSLPFYSHCHTNASLSPLRFFLTFFNKPYSLLTLALHDLVYDSCGGPMSLMCIFSSSIFTQRSASYVKIVIVAIVDYDNRGMEEKLK
ncbi:hypothetical protein L1887_22868 [Cichorium endivia]|nr:hypothetical protein L1887_22868 [Cichorium endivia]